MIDIPIAMAFLFGGICLSMGLVSLSISLHKDGEKVDLIFGIMCTLLFLFFIFPPFGFIIVDHAPYSKDVIIKRIFNLSFLAVFPWFVYYYTGYRKKFFPVLISSLMTITYFWMATTKTERQVPYFLFGLLTTMALIIYYSFLAVHRQFKSQSDQKAKWFRFALWIFVFFFIVFAVYQLGNNYFIKIFHQKLFFPINLFPLAFIIIMGIRMRTNTLEKFHLEKALGLRNRQWESLPENIQMIVVHLSAKGIVLYINPFGTKLLEYNESSEIIGKDWFEYFIPEPESNFRKEMFKRIDLLHQASPVYKNTIITCKGEERLINWNYEMIQGIDGKLAGVMCIGSDITEKELAFVKIQQLKSELEKENLILKGEPLPDWMQPEIIGKSEALNYAIQKAHKVASSQASVLLEGETGVGKELFANIIQRYSLRSDKPFVKVNCGGLPAELIEDELFGHEKGAFTGALQARKGRFEIANGGTIFLDEIGELPIHLQPKLLRVLQNGEFERIGGQETIKVDLRVIAATNRDLEQEVLQGKFRDDLFYRLNVYPITIPPLRNRKEDIPMLIRYYIEKKSAKHGKSFESISKADMNNLIEYKWPGNIRELKNVIERSVISSDGNSILRLDWFYNNIKAKSVKSVPASLDQVEKEHILKILEECRWRISGDSGAAEKLKMNPNTLRSKMKKLNINRQNIN